MRSEKQRIREFIWTLLEEKRVTRFPRPVYGRIPNFVGAEKAASRILGLKEYEEAKVVKVSPDSPQRSIRYKCLLDGKVLIMPTPRLREGFLLLEPSKIPRQRYGQASTIRGAFTFGRKVPPEDLPRIDFIVTGSVAVTQEGLRLGKGGGYGDLEYAILLEYGKIDRDIPIATNVHDLQIVKSIPRAAHDISLDIIATPSRLIKIENRPDRPRGVSWELLGDEKLEKIPLLKKLRERALKSG